MHVSVKNAVHRSVSLGLHRTAHKQHNSGPLLRPQVRKHLETIAICRRNMHRLVRCRRDARPIKVMLTRRGRKVIRRPRTERKHVATSRYLPGKILAAPHIPHPSLIVTRIRNKGLMLHNPIRIIQHRMILTTIHSKKLTRWIMSPPGLVKKEVVLALLL